MHFMHKAKDELSTFLKQVRRVMDERGLTQSALAGVLAVSQGHLSKMLRGEITGKTRAMQRLRLFIDQQCVSLNGATLSKFECDLVAAARQDPDFRNMLEAALAVMHKIHNMGE